VSLGGAFAHPGLWPALLLGPFVAAALVVLARARARRLATLVGPRLPRLTNATSPGAQMRRPVILGAALFLGALAAMGPLWGEGVRRIEERGVDVVVCLDVSQSMLARDRAPNRLAAAQREIRALARHSRGDRFGLVVFAGDARLAVPLTRDVESFSLLAARAGPLDVQRGGTDLGAALDTAAAALSGGGRGESEVVVLVTDGEDHEGRGLRTARTLRQRGVAVHCLATGSEAGAKIPVDGPGGESFLRDAEGREVVTTMDPQSLRRIADATGGRFIRDSERDGALVALYDETIAPMARRAFEAEERRERANRFRWPLLAAFGLWILDLCLTERLRR
jgi:Ca-activated chloride channel family protein